MNTLNAPISIDASSSAAMLQMISNFWASRALYIAAKLGLADLLQENQPLSSEELAEATNTHAASLYRVLRALTSVGVFIEDEHRRFSLTPLAATLRSDIPGSLRAFTIAQLGEDHYPAWGEFLHSVKTGETAFDHCFGMDIWQHRARNAEDSKLFDEAMTNFSSMVNAAIVANYDFSSFSNIVDIGGGNGSLITSILKANVKTKGVLFDLPHVVTRAQAYINNVGLAERCTVTAGDIFKAVPSGGDAYTMKWIIHDWDEQKSITILKNCHRAMHENSKLLLIEAIIPRDNAASFHKLLDLNMLVMTGGWEREETAYRALLAAAGFRMTRIIPTAFEICVIESVRV